MPDATRRAVLAGAAVLPLAGAAASAQTSTPLAPSPRPDLSTGRLLTVNGTRLWVDDSGPRDAPVLLYVHGGPGAGAIEFEAYMKPALRRRARLISVDQRGVLRSDPLPAGARLSLADLIADFEAIRAALGISRWTLIGHSFGGVLALRYALQHPVAVERLVYENPAIDPADAFRWLMASAAQLLNGHDTAAALEAVRLSQATTPLDAAYIAAMDRTLGALGGRRQDLYVALPRNRDIFSRLAKVAGLPDARWEQGATPGLALLANPDTLRPMLDQVAGWRGPLLLVRGAGDHVTGPAQIAAVERAGGRVVTVADAGHFIHVEQPEQLAELILAHA